jgi:hypothetical protein
LVQLLINAKTAHFTNTGSGQTQEILKKVPFSYRCGTMRTLRTHGAKNAFFMQHHLYSKTTINLPRQARDKHRQTDRGVFRRVLWDQHMPYPCTSCCQLDTVLQEESATGLAALRGKVAGLQAAVDGAAATAGSAGSDVPSSGGGGGEGVSVLGCVLIAVGVSTLSNCLLLAAMSKKQVKLGAREPQIMMPTVQ